ncbi:hypothetical protein MNEG_11901 [Monoraphidium neglectum]|uniref:Uncharacterized protein n=1 Tax=Monoraphidium neglectum TaxID=145388 RepID=A0A0D2J8H7_9CHLO|nr:hypothetical protein MNEG_11901 [Monoraphidium neglectum]KIY96062.1 hypothetical protein MNEG_11901 [Monoraphidium neglectum]|eukprot:XP_013895082.1 hypothetical protein MNEG_11901 [Monoraphidium neglectum]
MGGAEDDVDKALLLRGLQALGIRELEPSDVFSLSVLPALASADAPRLPPATLAGLLAFPVVAGLITDAELAAPAGPALAVVDARGEGAGGGGAEAAGGTGQEVDIWSAHAGGSGAFGGGGAQSTLQRLRAVAVVSLAGGGAARLSESLARVRRAAAAAPPPPGRGAVEGAAAAAVATAEAAASDGAGGVPTVYLPLALEAKIDLAGLFPSVSWRMVDPAYASAAPGMSPAAWRGLLLALGACEAPPVALRRARLTWQQALLSAWKAACPSVGAAAGGGNDEITFEDAVWPDIEVLIGSILKQGQPDDDDSSGAAAASSSELAAVPAARGKGGGRRGGAERQGGLRAPLGGGRRLPPAALAQLSAAAALVGSLWKQLEAAAALAARRVDAGAAAAAPSARRPGSSAAVHLPSSLLLLLQRTPWLPSPWAGGSGLAPGRLFLNGSEAHRLFGASGVPYLLPSLQQQPGLPGAMVRALGLRADTGLDTLLEVLQAWSDQAAGGSFTTSVAQMTALYAHMLDLLEHNPSSIPSASAAFLERPLIWVPDRAALPRPDAATWASAGRPAAAAPQGGGGGWGMLGDPYAVQSDYGFWPDGGAGRQRPEGPKHAGKQLPGRFYEPGLVRWFDATGLLEALPQETIHTRVLAHAYGAACAPVQALFTRALQRPRGGGGGGAAAEGGAWQQQGEQRRAVPLVLVNETIPDCLRALEAVAAGTPEVTADSEAFRQVATVWSVWSAAIARFKDTGGIGGLSQASQQFLRDRIAQLKVFPTTSGAWVSLAEGGLVVDDDEALSKLLTGIEGIHFLRVPPPLGKPAGRRARRARAWPL